MKLTNITNVDKFFEAVDKCEGKVELITGNGDRLNLKSKFNQYTAMIKMLAHGTIKQMEIVAEQKKDTQKLIAFMING
jgi:hypothetical protein